MTRKIQNKRVRHKAGGLPERAKCAVAAGVEAKDAASLDKLIHSRIRRGILMALARSEGLSFNELKSLLETSDGTLSVHARKLEESKYITCIKSFEARRPHTRFCLAPKGRRALTNYMDRMAALIGVTRTL